MECSIVVTKPEILEGFDWIILKPELPNPYIAPESAGQQALDVVAGEVQLYHEDQTLEGGRMDAGEAAVVQVNFLQVYHLHGRNFHSRIISV